MYQFQVPDASGKSLSVHGLMANGTDDITGITWNGFSYNHELEGGRRGRFSNMTFDQTGQVDSKGVVQLEVPYSSGAILNF